MSKIELTYSRKGDGALRDGVMLSHHLVLQYWSYFVQWSPHSSSLPTTIPAQHEFQALSLGFHSPRLNCDQVTAGMTKYRISEGEMKKREFSMHCGAIHPLPSTAKWLLFFTWELLLSVNIAPHPCSNYFCLCTLCEPRTDPVENIEQLLWSWA